MWMKNFRKTLLAAIKYNTAKVYITRGLKIIFSERALFATNTLTSGGCMFMGDLIQQELGRRLGLTKPQPNSRYDWLRLQRMFEVGVLLGSLHHFYYVYLDVLLPKVTRRNVTIKLLADQLFCAPATIILFFYLMCYLENKTFETATAEIKKKMLLVYMGDAVYWIPVQFINFYYVSRKYRVFYINIATLIYNVFLSFMKFDCNIWD